MADGIENGAKLLLDEIADIQKTKKMSHYDRLLLRVHEYQLRETISVRKRLNDIENSRALWVDRHPRAALAWGTALMLFLNSDVRHPFLEWVGENLQTLLGLIS